MKRPQDGAIITQFDQPGAEALGLIKMDFLGLRNLTILDDALDNIRGERQGRPGPRGRRRSTTRPTYELLGRGRHARACSSSTAGPMRALLRQMRPDNFEDISAVLALYRPGPMGDGLAHQRTRCARTACRRSSRSTPSSRSRCARCSSPTYGLIVYQEQVQKAAQILAGYTLGQADLLRRAMGKKKKEILDKEFVPFQAGMTRARLLRRRDQRGVGRARPVLRLRVQQGAHGRLRAGVVLDRVPQGELPDRVHGRRC